MQKLFLTSYRLLSDPKLYKTKDGQNEYYVFFIASLKPSNTGIYIKFSCQAWGENKSLIDRLKLKKGSLVDLTADINAFSKDGELTYYLYVKDISIMETSFEKTEKVESTMSPYEKQKEFVKMLELKPFG